MDVILDKISCKIKINQKRAQQQYMIIYQLQINKMKKLKQTLAKQQPPKKQKNNANLSSTLITSIKKPKHTDLNALFVYKSPGKTNAAEIGLDNMVTAIIENSVKNSGIFNIDGVVKEIIQKCQGNQKFNTVFREKARLNKTVENQQLKKLEQIKQLIQQILEKDQQTVHNKQNLQFFNEQLGKVIKNKNKITRKEKLDEYDRLIKLLSPRNRKTNLDFLSPNVKVKVVKEEVSIMREKEKQEQSDFEKENSRERLGSEGKRVKTGGSSHSNFKSQNGRQKLKKLMQGTPSLKIIKTKVSYDYSAILQASKSKIQPRSRNTTTINQKKSSGNDITTKLNKAKKNEAFVFYRPKPGQKKQ